MPTPAEAAADSVAVGDFMVAACALVGSMAVECALLM
jgi:hypothetical protein